MTTNEDVYLRKQPLISIVIPVDVNTLIDDLDKTIESVFNQNYDKYEIIIASSYWLDLSKYNHSVLKLVISGKKTPADILNSALGYSFGDYICFVKSGDILVYDYLSRIDKIDWAHPNVDWIIFNYSKYNIINKTDIKNRFSYLVNYFDLFNMYKRPFYISSSVCFRNRWVSNEDGVVHELVFNPAYKQYTFSDMMTKYALLYPTCYYAINSVVNRDPLVTRFSYYKKNQDSIVIPAVIPLSDYISSHADGFHLQKYLDLWSIHICLENLKRKQFYCADHNLDHLSDNFKIAKFLLKLCCKCKIPISAYIKNL